MAEKTVQLRALFILAALVAPGCGEQNLEDSRGPKSLSETTGVQSILPAEQGRPGDVTGAGNSQLADSNSQSGNPKVPEQSPASSPSQSDTSEDSTPENTPAQGVDMVASSEPNPTEAPSVAQPSSPPAVQTPWEPTNIYSIVMQSCTEPCHSVHKSFSDYDYFARNKDQILGSVESARMPPQTFNPDFQSSPDRELLLQYLRSL